MSNKFEELDDTFNVDADIVEVKPATPEKKIEEIKQDKASDPENPPDCSHWK